MIDEGENGRNGRGGSVRWLSGESTVSKPNDLSLTPGLLVEEKEQLLKTIL